MLDYVTDAVRAHLRGEAVPSLLPAVAMSHVV